MNALRQMELQKAIAGRIFAAHQSEEWDSLAVTWAEVGRFVASRVALLDQEGVQTTAHVGAIGSEDADLLRELRQAMSSSETGAWLTATVNISRLGDFSYAFSFDEKVSVGSAEPTERDYLDDLDAFPRTLEHVPAWYPTADRRQILAVPRNVAQPPNRGFEPGTQARFTDVAKFIDVFGDVLDHFGTPNDRVFTVGGGTLSERSAVPPVLRSESNLYEYRLTGALPSNVVVEVGETAPAFGGTGGATQVVFMAEDEQLLSAYELVDAGVLVGVTNKYTTAVTATPNVAGLFARHPELVDLAATCLGTDQNDVLTHHEDLPEESAVYVWRPIRGGGKIIVAEDGSALFGASSIDRETLFDLFRQGKRSDLSSLL